MSGVSDKIGNWFEEGYVVYQALRVLSGYATSVLWEGLGDDEKGIDCWVRERGRRIAIQTKARLAGTWGPTALVSKRVVRHARFQLERGDRPASEYHFVTEAKAPAWAELIDWSREGEAAPDCWSPDARKIVSEGLGLRPDVPTDVEKARDLLSRMKVDIIGAVMIERQARDFALGVAGERSRTLILELRDLLRSRLGIELHRRDLEEALRDRGVSVSGVPFDQDVAVRAEDTTRAFIRAIELARGLPSRLSRTETQLACEEVLAADASGGTVLVHGAPGVGKSEVLARVAESILERIPIVAGVATGIADGDIDERMLTALRAFAGTSPVVLVLDQVDELLSAGTGSRAALQAVDRLVQAARRLGVVLVLGCRTLEARLESRLGVLLAPRGGPAPSRIEVGRLPESDAAQVLAERGVPIDDLSLDLRHLARIPLFLTLMVDDFGGRGFEGVRTEFEVCRRWRESIDERLGSDAGRVVDELVERLDRTGAAVVDELSLSSSSGVARLCDAGYLKRVAPHWIAPAHHRLTDCLIAQRWAHDFADFDTVAKRLADRNAQDLHFARRLRLTMPVLGTMRGGPECIDRIMRSGHTRTLVRRAMLMGIAAIDAPTADLVRVVLGWLDDPTLRAEVAWIVLREQPQWFDVDGVRDWLDRTWLEHPDGREVPLFVVTSLGARRGREIAEHLARWSRDDAGLLGRARLAFWHDPALDADELFEQRLRAEESDTDAAFPVRWSELLEKAPHRAVRLLDARLRHIRVDALIQDGARHWKLALPSPGDAIPEAAAESDIEAWPLLKRWWLSLPAIDLTRVWSRAAGCDPVIVRLVELLAFVFSRHMLRVGVNEALSELPDPLRDLDRWLILRVGGLLPEHVPTKVADDLARWFRDDAAAAELVLSGGRFQYDYDLAGDFLEGVGRHLSEKEFAGTERFLVRHPGGWSTEQERGRREVLAESGSLRPNRHGVVAWRLLQRLPPDRLSPEARGRLGVLEQKFSGVAEEWTSYPRSLSGPIESPIPQDVADRWSLEQWLAQIRAAPDEERWRERDARIIEWSVASLADLLGSLVPLDPHRYLRLTLDLARAKPPVPEEVLARALEALVRAWNDADRGTQTGERRPGPLEVLLSDPAVLRAGCCAEGVVDAVEMWPAHVWPEPILRRLEEIASAVAEREPEIGSDEAAIGSHRLNDTACRALHAFRSLAQHQASVHPRVLSLAAILVGSADPGVRSEAAQAAMKCYASDEARANQILLAAAARPLVAAQDDIRHSLAYVAIHGVRADDRSRAREFLLGLVTNDPWIAARGGQSLMVLRASGVVDDAQVDALLQSNREARRGAAKTVAHWLGEDEAAEWMFARALGFANDDDPETGDAILLSLQDLPATLTTRRAFVTALAQTVAATRHPGVLVDACDAAGALLPVARILFALVDSIAGTSSSDPDPWLRDHHRGQLCQQLARLLEDAELAGDSTIAGEALDAWDRLLDAGIDASLAVLRGRVA